MPNLLVPSADFRSPTAVKNKSDMRDENLYAALVVAYGGSGAQTIFSIPKGQAIPALKGSAITVTQAHQTTYSKLTTDLTKAGELGSGIGDAAIRGVAMTLESCGQNPLTGVLNTYGATPYELLECQSKISFEFRIAEKKQIIGPMFTFPAFGGATGSVGISTTANNTTLLAGIATNGNPVASGRRLKVPIPCARNDTIEGIIEVAASASLVFSTSTGAGQSSLLWVNLLASIKGDVR